MAFATVSITSVSNSECGADIVVLYDFCPCAQQPPSELLLSWNVTDTLIVQLPSRSYVLLPGLVKRQICEYVLSLH